MTYNTTSQTSATTTTDTQNNNRHLFKNRHRDVINVIIGGLQKDFGVSFFDQRSQAVARTSWSECFRSCSDHRCSGPGRLLHRHHLWAAAASFANRVPDRVAGSAQCDFVSSSPGVCQRPPGQPWTPPLTELYTAENLRLSGRSWSC